MSYKMNLAGGEESSNFMSRIKSAFNSSTIIYIVAAIVFIIIAVIVYY